MALLRWLALPAIVASILIGFSFVDTTQSSTLVERLTLARAAAAQDLASSATAEIIDPVSPAPTNSVVADPGTSTAAAATPTNGLPPGTTTSTTTETPTAVPSGTPTPFVTETTTATTTATATATIIDANGGAITSPDGHATLTFPGGATTERLLVSVSSENGTEAPRLPESHMLSVWHFDATAVDRGGAAVHQFAQNIALDLRYSSDELFGLNEQNIRYWTFDEAQEKWIESAVTQSGEHRWSVALNHFSTQATSSDQTIALPPNIDTAQVNLNMGSATYSLPIKVSPSLDGLAPQLALSYDSGRIDDAPDFTAAGWVGGGWDLSVPFISRAAGPPGSTGGNRYFINLNGVGDELMLITVEPPPVPPSGDRHWETRHQSFLDITHKLGCDDAPVTDAATAATFTAFDCGWTVRDRSGRVYKFGTTPNSRRYYYSGPRSGTCDATCKFRYYQWDLTSTTETHATATLRADYTYTQVSGPFFGAPSWATWVVSSYPTTITYPGGQVKFTLSTYLDPPQASSYVHIYTRPDAASCVTNGILARVWETRNLQRVESLSQVGGTDAAPVYATAAQYDLNVADDTNGQGWKCEFSRNRLEWVEVRGTDPTGPALNRYSLSYGGLDQSFYDAPDGTHLTFPFAYSKYHLRSIDNGFGGSVAFTLIRTNGFYGPGTSQLDRYIVSAKTLSGGFDATSNPTATPPVTASNPPMTTSYLYQATNLSNTQNRFTYELAYGTDVLARGFEQVGAFADSQSIWTTFGVSGDLAGRALQVDRSGWADVGQGLVPHRKDSTSYGYQSSAVSGYTGVNFVRLGSVQFTMDDNSSGFPIHTSLTTYGYDFTYGVVTSVTNDGDSASSSNRDCRTTNTTYQSRKDVYRYLVLPSSESILPCAQPTATPAAETVYYYDGIVGSPTPWEGNYFPNPKGNLTAIRRLVDNAPANPNEKYVFVLHTYYPNGTLKSTSVPTYGSGLPPLHDTGTSFPDGDPSSKGRTEYQYDLLTGRFPHVETTSGYDNLGNALAIPTMATTTERDPVTGLPTSTTAPNGLVSLTSYDAFGRVLKRADTPDDLNSPTTSYDYSGWTGGGSTPVGVNSTVVTHRLNGSASVAEVYCSDGLGRQTQIDSPVARLTSTTMQVQRQQIIYNDLGFITNTRTFDPGTSSLACGPANKGDTNVPNNIVEHDAFGNPSTLRRNDGASPSPGNASILTRLTNGLTTTTVDQNKHQTIAIADGFGRTLTETTYRGDGTAGAPYTAYSTTNYEYDLLGDVTKTTDVSGNHTDVTYDALGRKKKVLDPDMSGGGNPWTYTYDAAGNLTTQTDARTVKTVLTYDSLNRLTRKAYDVGTTQIPSQGNVDLTYDTYSTADTTPTICNGLASASAVGHLTMMADSTGATRWCYDARGRQVAERHVITDAICSITRVLNVLRSFDSGNRLTSLTYPDAEQVLYAYDDLANGGGALVGMSSSLGSYIAGSSSSPGVTYHVTGKPTSIALGDGYKTTYSYDPLYRLQRILTDNTAIPATAQDLSLSYDLKGNVTGTVDTLGNTWAYGYDELDRLTTMNLYAPSGPLKASYGYGSTSDPLGGKIGNLLVRQEGTSTSTFTYAASRPHAPATVNSGAGVTSLTYDNNGNLVQTVQENFTYDAANRMTGSQNVVSAENNDYLYDGSGNLVQRRVHSVPTPTIDQKDAYVDDVYEEHSDGCSTSVATTKYYRAFGRIIAQRRVGGLTYLLASQNGSTVGAIDTNGTRSQVEYYPFGRIRTGAAALLTDKGFTGQQQEPNSTIGAYFYKSRFYSTTFAHFVAPDLVTIDGLDRYTYTRNSPIGHNDPTGMDTASDLTDLRKAFERSGLTEFEFLTKLDTYLYGGFDETRTNHTFRDTEGHLGEDTLGNRWRLNQARYNENNYAGTDRAGNRNYIQDEADGTQTWVSVKNGKIVNGGVNKGGRPYEWDTTLQRLKRVVSDEGATGDTNADTSSEIPIDEPIEPTSFEGGVGPPNIVSGAGPGASTDRFLRCLENPDAEFLPGC